MPDGVADATASQRRCRTSMDWTPRALNWRSVNDGFGWMKNGPQEYLRTLQGWTQSKHSGSYTENPKGTVTNSTTFLANVHKSSHLLDKPAKSQGTKDVRLNIQQINPRGFFAANSRFFYLPGNETDKAEKF